MSASVTPRYLLEGALYALQQCGLLLRDAGLLYEKNSYASAVLLTLLARESLGQWRMLRDERHEVIAGKGSR
jgi:AbiV family abortive infection protein